MGHIHRHERFYELFSKENRVLIIINADPDAISSAMAVKRLLWRRVTSVTLTHFNEISRPDNQAMIRLLDAGLIPLCEINDRDFNKFVVVDSQPDHHECFTRYAFDAIIDHHPISCDAARFVDIRPDYGACASIMTDYLKAAGVNPSVKLATALLFGIKTDTAGFSRQAGMNDIRAFQYLYKFANSHLLTRIEQAEMSEEDLVALARAIENREIHDRRLFSHLGNIDNPDQCVIIADFFMKLSNVNWSIVSGILEGRLIIIFRNDGLRKGAGNTAKEAFSAFGSAGGHKTMARVEIAMKDLEKGLNLSVWIRSRVEESAGTKTD